MKIEAVTPTATLPATDKLFLVEGRYYVRLRITQRKSGSEVLVGAAGDALDFKFQCSLAKDASGDVMKDAAGANILLSAEVHSVVIDALLDRKQSLDAWVAERMVEQCEKSARKAFMLLEVLPKYQQITKAAELAPLPTVLPAAPSKP